MSGYATPLEVAGAWLLRPRVHADARGSFAELFKAPDFVAATGRALPVEQVNYSTSRRGVVRGIHFSDLPPGQAKYVTCVSGRVLDVVVDIRVGSPTFGRWVSVELPASEGLAVFVSEGLGHGFCALEDSTVTYLCSTPYAPDREHEINPLDPALGITWPVEPLLSDKDRAAPTLGEAQERGLLPVYVPEPSRS